MSLPLNQVITGDCTEVMREWPENSVDCIVTDPPYGLSFMGKDWDKTLPPREAFEEIIRVLKPGALAFVMSSPRQDLLWRMLSMLEGVGFELTQSYIDWIYKTGFPKAYDVSKGIDKKLGLDRQIIGKNPNYRDPDTDHHERWNKAVLDKNITSPTSELAKKWDGWKSQTGLKPAHEPILMVNKPFTESTIVDNVLKWGTGAINVDSCRIPFEPYGSVASNPLIRLETGAKIRHGDDSHSSSFKLKKESGEMNINKNGRFPANLIISGGALDTGEITKSGKLELHHNISEDKNIYGEYKGRNQVSSYGDEGSPYRFFDLDAWAEHHGFLDVTKPSKAERDFGLTTQPLKIPKSKFNLSDGSKDMRFDGVIPTPRRNIHPTVKPVKLMAYLIELGCPPDGVVVDPFVGSGTTCIAAKQLRRKWIGIEINPEYAEIAEARINIRGPLDQFMEAEK